MRGNAADEHHATFAAFPPAPNFVETGLPSSYIPCQLAPFAGQPWIPAAVWCRPRLTASSLGAPLFAALRRSPQSTTPTPTPRHSSRPSVRPSLVVDRESCGRMAERSSGVVVRARGRFADDTAAARFD
jgi:hypothetical protein